MRHLLLVKYGEIALKGKNRPLFERTLTRNIKGALERVGGAMGPEPAVGQQPEFRVRAVRGRLAVDLAPRTSLDRAWRLAEAVSRVFGVVGVTVGSKVPLHQEEISREAVRVAADAAGVGGVATFKIEARRSNKGYALTSPEVAAIVGRRVLDEVPGLTVDVHEPDLRVGVEIREDGAYIYGRTLGGPGGLPVGVSGRAVVLISGGIDSPVAVWMAMKRGVVPIPLHFWSFPFTGERAREKVVDLCRALGAWGPLPDLLVCPFTEIQTAIRDRCPEELRVILMRRMMMRVATRVAEARGALVIVTGESLGQVASQTLESLATIEAVTSLPILRPLIGLDKEEIIARARHIGTFDLSILPYEDCCTLFVPARPRTKPSPAEAEAAEQALDVDGLIERALAATGPVPPAP